MADRQGVYETPNASDPWMLSQNGYDPDKIYTRASDGNGQSALIHVKISPALHHELQAMVQGGKIPGLRTHADVVRDALIHRMHHYREMLADDALGLFAALDVEVRQAELDRVATDREAWLKLISTLDTQLGDLIKAGEFDEARWLIAQNEQVGSMAPVYLERLDAVLDTRRTEIDRLAPMLPGMDAGHMPYAH